MSRLSMLLAAGVICVASTSWAQDNNSVPPATSSSEVSAAVSIKISAKQAADFGLALGAIAAQSKVAIVAEGIPFNPVLPISDVASLTESYSVEELVDKIAAAYDYRVVRVKASHRTDARNVRPQPHLFVLVKQYTNPNDLPDVTLEECQSAMRDVNQMLISISPNPPIRVNTPYILSIADSLTTEQEAKLKQGISVSELPDTVRGKIQQFGLHLYAGMRLGDAFGALAGLIGMDKATLCYKEYQGKKELGFDNYLARNQYGDTALYTRMLSDMVSNVGPYVSNEPTELNQKPADKGTDKTVSRMPVLGATTLQETVTQLSVATTFYSVDRILAEKQVVAAGLQNAPSQEVAEGLASLYGLRLSRLTTDGVDRYRLARRVPPMPRQAAGVFDLVRQALPEPLLHATFDGEQDERVQASFKHYRTTDPNLPYAERMKKFEEGRKKFQEEQQRIKGAAFNMRRAAAQQFQKKAEQLLVNHPKGVRFTALPSSMKNCYGIIAISTFIESLNTVPETPDYIKDWNNSVISGGAYFDPDAHRPAYSLRFMGRDKEGNPHEESAYIVWDNRPSAQQAIP